MNVLYEDDTILVYDEVENGVEMRTLKFGPPFTHVKQGFIRLADPVFVPAPAHANMLFGASLVPKPASALVLGVGVGSIPSVLQAIDPAMHIDIVDYDPRIFQLARQFFFRSFDPQRSFCMDAATYVEQCSRTYDFICINLWSSTGVAPFVLEERFWQHIKRISAPDGVVGCNATDDLHKRFCEFLTRRFPLVLSLAGWNTSVVCLPRRDFAIVVDRAKAETFLPYGVDLSAILANALLIAATSTFSEKR